MHPANGPPGVLPDDGVKGAKEGTEVARFPFFPLIDAGLVWVHELDLLLFLHFADRFGSPRSAVACGRKSTEL